MHCIRKKCNQFRLSTGYIEWFTFQSRKMSWIWVLLRIVAPFWLWVLVRTECVDRLFSLTVDDNKFTLHINVRNLLGRNSYQKFDKTFVWSFNYEFICNNVWMTWLAYKLETFIKAELTSTRTVCQICSHIVFFSLVTKICCCGQIQFRTCFVSYYVRTWLIN